MKHRLFLLRHGNTIWSDSGKHTSISDIPLNLTGEIAAQALMSTFMDLQLHNPYVISSPRIRAISTAHYAGLKISTIDERLREWDYGNYEGKTTAEIQIDHPIWTIWSGKVPGGENIDQICNRADSLLKDVKQLLDSHDVVLVGHGHFSRVLITRWLNEDISLGAKIAMEPATIAELNQDRHTPIIRSLGFPKFPT